MILNIPINLKLECWDYLSKNNMGNRHSANGNREQQFVGLIGEILTKNVFDLNHKYTSGFDGGFDFEYKGKKRKQSGNRNRHKFFEAKKLRKAKNQSDWKNQERGDKIEVRIPHKARIRSLFTVDCFGNLG